MSRDFRKRLMWTPRAVPMISPAEAERIRTTILSRRVPWIERVSVGGRPFFTVGAASYLDAIPFASYYYNSARVSNAALRRYFGWVYTRLRGTLEQALDAPVTFEQGMALPGFHVFLGAAAYESKTSSVHADLQYRLVEFKNREIDEKTTLSFTMLVRAPALGAGLTLWDALHEPEDDSSTLRRDERLKASSRKSHAYSVGTLFLHSGRQYHAIAPIDQPSETDERITLQGHAVFADGEWYAYW
ncbi:MAG: hypothetical protein HYV07_30250 [Deltaproteobacteria bacterium]|nr:hypothetical protein [Deltaproteobacteria bacterium]